jgi:hypothetical protein
MAALCQACIPACGCEYTLDEKGSKERAHEYGISEMVGNVEMYDVVYAEADENEHESDKDNDGPDQDHACAYDDDGEYDDEDDLYYNRHISKRNATQRRMHKHDIHM